MSSVSLLVSGQNYEAFIRSRLTDRLGMTVSFTLEELEASIDAAHPYMMHEDERLAALRLPISVMAAGAMNTTSVADLAHGMRLHLAKGDYDGERLLSAALINELHAPRVYYVSPVMRNSERRTMGSASGPLTIVATVWFGTVAARSAGAR